MRHLRVVFFFLIIVFLFLDKIPILSFYNYPIFIKFRYLVFATDGSQISSLIMDTLYIVIIIICFFTLSAISGIPKYPNQ